MLSAADWEVAALAAIERGGLGAVSVEGIARALATTKGSFYWHFQNREELLAAALARWEADYTEQVIADLERIPSPRERLVRLLRAANGSESTWRIHVALGASATDPLIASVLGRVSKRRLGYLETCYRKLGLPKSEARQRALLAYASYLGFLRLRVESPEEIPSHRGMQSYLESTIAALVPAVTDEDRASSSARSRGKRSR